MFEMEGRMLFLVEYLFLLYLVIDARESISAVVRQVRLLNDEVVQLKADIPRIEQKLGRDLEMSEVVIKDEISKSVLPDLIDTRVERSFTDLFRNTSLDDVINSHVTSEIRDLKVKQGQLKRQYESILDEIEEIKREKTDNQDKLIKDLMDRVQALELQVQGRGAGVEGKAKTDRNSTMDSDVVEDQSSVLEYLLETTNKTSQRVDLLEHQRSTIMDIKQPLTCNLEYGYKATKTPSSRLLVTSFHKSLTDSHMLSFDGDKVTSYPQLKINNIISMVYDPTHKQILFSRAWPYNTYSKKLDGGVVSMFLANISSYGMAVDEWRQLVFMTTYKPMESVGKVSTNGGDFVYLADLNGKGNYPFAVALDPEKELVYMCNYDKVMSVDYNGNDFKVLFSGGNILGLALDMERNSLYFSNEKTIMKMSLWRNISEVVADTDMISVNLRYHNNTVYISGKWSGDVLGLDVHSDTLTKLATFETPNVISLLP